MAEKTESEKLEAEAEPKHIPNPRDEENRAVAGSTSPDAVQNSDGASANSTSTTAPLVTEYHLEEFNTTTRHEKREQLDGPPELPFNLGDHKLSLSIFAFLALAECCFVPIALYYGLSKGTNMRSGMPTISACFKFE